MQHEAKERVALQTLNFLLAGGLGVAPDEAIEEGDHDPEDDEGVPVGADPVACDRRRRGGEREQEAAVLERCAHGAQWISGSAVGAVPSRKSKSQPSFACFTWREKIAP